MRDWQAFVRTRLPLPDLIPERQARIVREVASQLEDFQRDALARGATAADAEAYAAAQITDWARLAADVRGADRAHVQPRAERLAVALENRTGFAGGAGQMLAHMLRDGRLAIRQLIKTPGFTIVAVLTLALGIGATSAIFSVVNGVVLRPLPYGDPGALVRVHEVVPQYGRFSVAPATFLDWRQQATTLEHIVAYASTSATFDTGDNPERIQGAAVSWDLFELLRVRPSVGAGFTAEQDAPGANNVIVLSHGTWQRRFGGDPQIVGRTISLNGIPVSIVGVMPADFYFPTRQAEFWRPIALPVPNQNRGGHFLGVIGRAKPGISIEGASAEMKTISERLALQYPDASANESAVVVALHEQVVGSVRPALLTLLAAVSVVVLIACANVANLLLVRAAAREKEVAIRLALGAGRRRVILQMLIESLILAAAGGALGVLLAYLAIPLVQSLGATSIPRVGDITLDLRVLGFAMGASLLTGLLFGLAPAWHASRTTVGAVLKESGRSSTAAGGRWVRSGLLVVEVALSIVLLVGAALLLRSFAKLTHVDPGFDPDRVLAFQVSLPPGRYPQPPARLAFFDALLAKLAAVPGVTDAGMVHRLPMVGGYVLSFDVRGRPQAKPGEEPSANYRIVSPGFLKTLGTPIRRGRGFTPEDTATGQKVAIVDEAFVKRHFANENPIGQGLDIGDGTDGFYDIVGVAADVRDTGLDAAPEPTMYVPFTQNVSSTMWMVVRTDGDPAQLSAPAREAVRSIDRTLPAYSMNPLSSVISSSIAQQRFSMLLLGVFALIALFLAGVGLYGVVAYSVSQRTREIGLRMAIGAAPTQVLRMIVGGGMKLALVGVAIGLAGAVALSHLVATLLFEVPPSDPISYAGTAVVLLAIAAIACFVPARRAMKVDPLVAMQGE